MEVEPVEPPAEEPLSHSRNSRVQNFWPAVTGTGRGEGPKGNEWPGESKRGIFLLMFTEPERLNSTFGLTTLDSLNFL